MEKRANKAKVEKVAISQNHVAYTLPFALFIGAEFGYFVPEESETGTLVKGSAIRVQPSKLTFLKSLKLA